MRFKPIKCTAALILSTCVALVNALPAGAVTVDITKYRGEWTISPSYYAGQVVTFQQSSYIGLSKNSGKRPDQNPTVWNLLAAQGPEGVSGPQGPEGAAGPQGLQGETGPQGLLGPQGDTGTQGPQGSEGPQGLKGDTGDVGAQGFQGFAGANGLQGPQGVDGVAGRPGEKGDKGDTGDVGLQGPPGPTASTDCPLDSVRSGPSCIDTYEASVWETTDAGLIAKIQDGSVNLSDLNVPGTIRRGVSSDDYDLVSCPDTPVSDGGGCLNYYAVSIPGVLPSRFMTWFQAIVFARNSGKRLPTNAEWQMAAFGTFDPGLAHQAPHCITGIPAPQTGDFYLCISDVGAYNMIGNVEEFVADWLGPDVLFRGGSYNSSMSAGVLKSGTTQPGVGSALIGFRGMR